jgi:HlyD family type I secretion membrane fusion protein
MFKRLIAPTLALLRQTYAHAATRLAALWPRKSAADSAKLSGQPAAAASLRGMLWPVVVLGIGFGVLLFGSLATWANRAPLASAAVASGNVSADSGRRTIQHLEGGIIRAIHVKDGQVVKAGDLLYTLEPMQARAQFASKRQQWMRLMVTRARLEAHRADDKEFTPPTFPEDQTDTGFQRFVADQISLFKFRRRSLIERDQILGQQILQLGQQTEAKKKENESLSTQKGFLSDEIKDKETLIAQNLSRKPEWLALLRARADIMGRIASNEAEIARISERVGEIKLSMLTNQTQFDQDISDQLAKVNGDIAQLDETLPASEDILKRTDIVAPVDGTVFNLRFKTIGGVVRPGEALLDIEPVDDDLIIDAKLSPNDIDVVRPGLVAEVYLTPYVSRHTPRLKGTVIRVSPDIMHDASPPNAAAGSSAGSAAGAYYEVKVRIDRHEFSGLGADLHLYPGMPAEVYIMTGTRTFAQYFLDPLSKSFRRSFREK